MRRPPYAVLLAAAVVTSLLTACTSTHGVDAVPRPSPSTKASAVVNANSSAELVTSSMTVRLPVGAVAGEVTATSVEETSAASPTASFSADYSAALTPVPGRPVVQVDLEGRQPALPLTVRFLTPKAPSDDAILVLSSVHDGVPYLVAVTNTGDGYSEAQVSRLSPLQPAWLSKKGITDLVLNVVSGLVRTVSRPVGDIKAYDACTQDTVDLGDGTTVTASPNGANPTDQPLALCLEKAGQLLRVRVASNDTLPWHGAVGSGDVFGTWEPDRDLPDVDGAISNVMFTMARQSKYGEGLVMPFETTSWVVDLPKGATGGVYMQVDNRAWTVSLAAFAAAFVAGVFVGDIPDTAEGIARLIKVTQEGKEGMDCLTSVMNNLGKLADGTADGTAEQVQAVIAPAVACGPVLLAAAGVAVSANPLVGLVALALSGGSTLVAGGLVGIYREIAGKQMGWQLTRTAVKTAIPAQYVGSWSGGEVTWDVARDGSVWMYFGESRCGEALPSAPNGSCVEIIKYRTVKVSKDVVSTEWVSGGVYPLEEWNARGRPTVGAAAPHPEAWHINQTGVPGVKLHLVNPTWLQIGASGFDSYCRSDASATDPCHAAPGGGGGD